MKTKETLSTCLELRNLQSNLDAISKINIERLYVTANDDQFRVFIPKRLHHDLLRLVRDDHELRIEIIKELLKIED